MIKRLFLKKIILFFFFFLISLKLNAKKTLNNLIIQTKNNRTIKSLIMFDPIFLKYHLSPNHPEDPKRIKYIGEDKGYKAANNKVFIGREGLICNV